MRYAIQVMLYFDVDSPDLSLVEGFVKERMKKTVLIDENTSYKIHHINELEE